MAVIARWGNGRGWMSWKPEMMMGDAREIVGGRPAPGMRGRESANDGSGRAGSRTATPGARRCRRVCSKPRVEPSQFHLYPDDTAFRRPERKRKLAVRGSHRRKADVL